MSENRAPAFWLVWNDGGRAPMHKHDSIESARTEAERLARANPGQSFVVLESLSRFALAQTPIVVTTYDLDIPF